MKKTILIFTFLILIISWIAGHAENQVDPEEDSALKALWGEMIDRLTEGDIEGALKYFANSSRWRYEKQFRMLGNRLPGMFSEMRAIESVYIKKDDAKYRVKIKEEGRESTGYIWFRKNIFGRWKIEKF